MIYLIVGLAGVLGALLRYGVGLGFAACWQTPPFLATLAINLTGCAILGWFNGFLEGRPRLHPWWKAGFGTGFVGSYTTFSTFSYEMFTLLRSGAYGNACLYGMGSLCGGLLMAWVGYRSAARRSSKQVNSG